MHIIHIHICRQLHLFIYVTHKMLPQPPLIYLFLTSYRKLGVFDGIEIETCSRIKWAVCRYTEDPSCHSSFRSLRFCR